MRKNLFTFRSWGLQFLYFHARCFWNTEVVHLTVRLSYGLFIWPTLTSEHRQFSHIYIVNTKFYRPYSFITLRLLIFLAIYVVMPRLSNVSGAYSVCLVCPPLPPPSVCTSKTMYFALWIALHCNCSTAQFFFAYGLLLPIRWSFARRHPLVRRFIYSEDYDVRTWQFYCNNLPCTLCFVDHTLTSEFLAYGLLLNY